MIEPTQADTFPMPKHGFTCFHCGETFTTPGSARIHFGFDPSSDPGCRIKVGAERGLLMALRKAEADIAEAWNAIHNESTEAGKAYHAQQTRHRDQLLIAEEAGFERGMADSRPRVHLWPTRFGCAWSFGPVGNRIHLASLGECFQAAAKEIGDRPFVVIVEPRA